MPDLWDNERRRARHSERLENLGLEEGSGVRLIDYIRVLRRNLVLILAFLLLGTAAGAVYTLLQRPMYQATTKVFVSTTSPSVQDLSQGNIYLQQVVKSYADVATTPYVLDPVIQRLHLQTSSEQLAKSVSASAPLDTVIVEIDVTDQDPVNAARIANAVSTSLTDVVSQLVPQTDTASPVKITRVQPALVPSQPQSPKLLTDVLVGALLGLLIGLALTAARQALDTRVRSEDDVRALTHAPVLGGIALDKEAESRPLIVHADPQNRRAEAFRSIRTNLQFLSFDQNARVIVVTSSTEAEGKSTTVANLAIALAEADEKVLVIDADLRRPKIGEYLGLDASLGLTDVLIKKAKLSDAIQVWGDGAMQVLPAGRIPPNPSELLGSDSMREILKELSGRFRTIIVDAPPLLPVTDAALLSRLASGALVLCAVGRTHRPQLAAAMAALRTVDARVLGAVLTMVPTRGPDADSYGAYGYGYGAGYGAPGREQSAQASP